MLNYFVSSQISPKCLRNFLEISQKSEYVCLKRLDHYEIEQIYRKYAEEYNVDVNEIKDRLEAYKSKKEQITYNVEKPEDAKKVDAEPGDTVNVGMDM